MHIYRYLLLLVAAAVCAGCHTTVNEVTLGTIVGNVSLYGVDGQLLSAQDGATVQLEGTPYKTTTNARGDWQLNNVPAGIYNVLFAKAGFDSAVDGEFHFSGAGTAFIDHWYLETLTTDSVILDLQVSVIDSVRRIDVEYQYQDSALFVRPGDSVYFHGNANDKFSHLWRSDTEGVEIHVTGTGTVTGTDPVPYVMIWTPFIDSGAVANPIIEAGKQIALGPNRTFPVSYSENISMATIAKLAPGESLELISAAMASNTVTSQNRFGSTRSSKTTTVKLFVK